MGIERERWCDVDCMTSPLQLIFVGKLLLYPRPGQHCSLHVNYLRLARPHYQGMSRHWSSDINTTVRPPPPVTNRSQPYRNFYYLSLTYLVTLIQHTSSPLYSIIYQNEAFYGQKRPTLINIYESKNWSQE